MMGSRGSTYCERRDGVMVSRMVEIIVAGIAGQTNIAGLTWAPAGVLSHGQVTRYLVTLHDLLARKDEGWI